MGEILRVPRRLSVALMAEIDLFRTTMLIANMGMIELACPECGGVARGNMPDPATFIRIGTGNYANMGTSEAICSKCGNEFKFLYE